MKILINAKKLAQAIKLGEQILKENTGREFNIMATHIYIKTLDDSNEIQFTASVNNINLRHTIKLDGQESILTSGELTVDVIKLAQVASKEGDVLLTIEKAENDKFVKISSAGITISLVCTNGQGYPVFPDEYTSLKDYFQIPRITLLNLIKQTQFCVSTKSHFEPLLHLLFEIYRDKFISVGCDNYRIGLAEVDYKNIFKDTEEVTKNISDDLFLSSEEKVQLQFTNKSATIIRNALESKTQDLVKIYLNHEENKVTSVLIELEGTSIITRLNRSKFPIYNEALPSEYVLEGQINKTEFDHSLSTSTTINPNKIDIQFLNQGQVIFLSRNQHQEESQATIEATLTGESHEIALDLIALNKIVNEIPNVTNNENKVTVKIGRIRNSHAIEFNQTAYDEQIKMSYILMPAKN